MVLTESDAADFENEQNTPENTNPPVEEVVEEVVVAETPEPVKPVKSNSQNIQLHTDKQGETLFSLSKEFHISLEDLREANELADNTINVGDVIKIPLDKAQVVTPEKPTISEEVKETPVVETIVETTPEKPKETEAVYHIVQPGETLYRIHVNYKVPIWKLRKLNHLKGNYIKVGQKLRVK